MKKFLPLIVGFGGYNAAGRSSGHQAYNRMVFESLNSSSQKHTVDSLANLMNLDRNLAYSEIQKQVLAGTLIRRLDANLFDPDKALAARRLKDADRGNGANQYVITRRDLPNPVPANWHLEPLDEAGSHFRVTLPVTEPLYADVNIPMAIQSAGQLPSGFDPSAHYRSLHHPRGLQLTVLGASDAVRSMGMEWSSVLDKISPDQVGVYSSSVMSQLDTTGLGGMMQARIRGNRATSKQLPLGLNSMPADFVNAYILGSVGSTAAVTGACATFLYNLLQAVEDIKEGKRKVAVVGASEAPIIPEVMDGYAAMSALATDENLATLDGVAQPDYRRASRPFGENCGFTLAESSQYVVLMADDLAMETGAQVFGAVPSVYVNADGYKKSISAPGAGNYITMAKSVGLVRSLLGEEVVQHGSFVQAHGSSTPQNRVTESKIFDEVAKAFDIEKWPVAAVKSYVGHSLGPASGDQMAASLGVFAKGILPGIKTIDHVAKDIFSQRLDIRNTDTQKAPEERKVAFLNSKGFGGNNATAAVFAPEVVNAYLEKKYGKASFTKYAMQLEHTQSEANAYIDQANSGKLNPIYTFGTHIIDEQDLQISKTSMRVPGFKHEISLETNEGFTDFND